jgi:hypothetical protein
VQLDVFHNTVFCSMQIIGRDCVYYFHDMIVEMIKWGFQEGKTLFGFGYDFRQSNRCVLNQPAFSNTAIISEFFSQMNFALQCMETFLFL